MRVAPVLFLLDTILLFLALFARQECFAIHLCWDHLRVPVLFNRLHFPAMLMSAGLAPLLHTAARLAPLLVPLALKASYPGLETPPARKFCILPLFSRWMAPWTRSMKDRSAAILLFLGLLKSCLCLYLWSLSSCRLSQEASLLSWSFISFPAQRLTPAKFF